ncbi:hypothetical protein [Hymenobacter metallicola]|uniref:Uncharacterized protein n=1 Tax=Hymenobacter metallicola TaxID=2563114 RepID=A0A4Z0QHR8_9BACT|nr:hypothetical protein [Hymenobacter metallicola]TGE28793.1 hypothetical protein E5K02_04850 [Hymenobacter metallicola]
MNSSPNDPDVPAENQPESLEESVMASLNMFDPATAIYELERLDEDADELRPATAPPAPDETKPGV